LNPKHARYQASAGLFGGAWSSSWRSLLLNVVFGNNRLRVGISLGHFQKVQHQLFKAGLNLTGFGYLVVELGNVVRHKFIELLFRGIEIIPLRGNESPLPAKKDNNAYADKNNRQE
jgi:hypothetical protein